MGPEDEQEDGLAELLFLVVLCVVIFGIGVLMGIYDRAQVLRDYAGGIR